MRKLELAQILDSYHLLMRLWGRIENKANVRHAIARDDHGDEFPQIKAQIEALATRFDELNLRIPHKWAAKLLEKAKQGATYGTLEKETEYLHRCLIDHFEQRTVLIVDEGKTEAYEAAEPLFGLKVWAKFQNSQRDIEEAGKCLALNRNTAMVFHLMRAMEAALRALAGKIGVTVQDGSGKFVSWGVIVRNIKDRIPHCLLQSVMFGRRRTICFGELEKLGATPPCIRPTPIRMKKRKPCLTP